MTRGNVRQHRGSRRWPAVAHGSPRAPASYQNRIKYIIWPLEDRPSVPHFLGTSVPKEASRVHLRKGQLISCVFRLIWLHSRPVSVHLGTDSSSRRQYLLMGSYASNYAIRLSSARRLGLLLPQQCRSTPYSACMELLRALWQVFLRFPYFAAHYTQAKCKPGAPETTPYGRPYPPLGEV